MKRLNVIHALAVFFVFSQIVWGAVPQLINFQGVLKDGSFNPVADGSYSVTFTIYDAPTGGNNLWTETQSVNTTDGLFAVLLGSTNPVPDTAFTGSNRWLGIAVAPDGEMSTRQQLASVGYAYRVNSVDDALGGTINGAIDAPGMSSKIRFHFDDVSDFPSPTTYHGMFAHAHNQGAAYYAHAAQWVRLADSAHPHSSLAASDLDPNPALSVDADGNVGIGTTSPAKKLDVVGSIRTSDTLFSSNLSSNSPLQLQAPAGNTRMYIDDATGNVGIGSTSPTGNLHVKGTGGVVNLDVENSDLTGSSQIGAFHSGVAIPSGIYLQALGPNSSEPGVVKLIADGGLSGALKIIQRNQTTPAPITFHTSGDANERMRITGSGNVGIGTASPGASNLLELSSTTKGFVLPRMTKAQRDAIASPVAGMMVYQTDNTPGLRVYNGTNWMRFTETAD